MLVKSVLFVLCFVSVSFSKPFVTTNYNYYNIYPTNSHKLEENLDKSSPLSFLGSIRHGTINWKLKYFYKKEKRGNNCSVGEVITKVDVLYTVPKIADKKASKKVRKAFSRYYTILKEHLNKQKAYAVKAAEEIEEKLMKQPPISRNCDIVKSDVKKIANKIIKKYKKKNKNYEIKTYEGFFDSINVEKL